MLSDHARALERLLIRRRELSGALLYADASDRWGPKEGPERDALLAETEAVQRDHDKVTEDLAALSRDTWERDREAVIAWANAHIALLERFSAARANDEAESTACFVAKREIEEWRQVARGERGYVDENGYYVQIDPAQHAEHFGAS